MRLNGILAPGGLIFSAAGYLLGYRNPVTGDDVAIPHDRVATLASASGVVPVDLNAAWCFELVLTENITAWTFSNLPPSGLAKRVSIRITQHASAAKTVAWPASFQWAGGSAGAVSSDVGAVDILDLVTHDNGVTWNAAIAKAFAVPA